jgi:hypothetical protein
MQKLLASFKDPSNSFSAYPLRSLRLSGKPFHPSQYRGDAENAEDAQRLHLSLHRLLQEPL